MSSSVRKGPKSKRFGRKARGNQRQATKTLLEQPIADSSGTIPCQICGHGVDPSRMHIHMVRFHGAALRPGAPQT